MRFIGLGRRSRAAPRDVSALKYVGLGKRPNAMKYIGLGKRNPDRSVRRYRNRPAEYTSVFLFFSANWIEDTLIFPHQYGLRLQSSLFLHQICIWPTALVSHSDFAATNSGMRSIAVVSGQSPRTSTTPGQSPPRTITPCHDMRPRPSCG